MTEARVAVSHPAKFSDKILERLDEILPDGVAVLDPFAGVGRVHELGDGGRRETVGVEIEPEWAAMHEWTVVGDATRLPFADGSFDWVVTSPTYGNRMADHHDAQERCRTCGGTGEAGVREGQVYFITEGPCPKCDGAGRREYKRLTYRHQLGRELHPNNSGGMQWGQAYRDLHRQAWAEAYRVLVPGGFLALNVKNHWRKGEVARVMEWHLNILTLTPWRLVSIDVVETPGMRMGANREAREGHEFIIVVQRLG